MVTLNRHIIIGHERQAAKVVIESRDLRAILPHLM